MFHAAIPNNVVTNELIIELRGTGQSIEKLSSIVAFAISLRTSEKEKWFLSFTACLRFGVFSNLQA